MLTSARIRDQLRPAQLDWISALRAISIRVLVGDGALQLSLFDEQNLFEITHPDYPGERLVACRNPALADAARPQARRPARRHRRRPGQGRRRGRRRPAAVTTPDKIGMRGRQGHRPRKMGKHYLLDIRAEPFTFTHDQASIDAEAALDGIYVLRTSVAANALRRETSCAPTRPRRPRTLLPHPSTANWTCGRSGTASPTGYARTCSYACCPTTSAGT